MKLLKFFLTGIIFFIGALIPAQAFAALQITEVMYNPLGNDTGREWIELYNTGSTEVTMTAGTKGWKINDGSNHNLVDPVSGVGRGSLSLAPGETAIFTNDPTSFVSEYPSGSYSVIKAAISLNNTGATLTLLDDTGVVVDTASYTKDIGAYEDGNSLHRSGTTFVAAAADPGVYSPGGGGGGQQQTSDPPADTGNSSTSSQTSQSSAVQTGGGMLVPTLVARITADAVVVTGAGSFFSGAATGATGEPLGGLRYLWNFGDGATVEGQTVFHTYAYPGRYIVFLTAASGVSAGMARTGVEAVPAQIALLLGPDGSLILLNQSQKEINVGLWSLGSGTSTYIIPQNTILLGTGSVRFAPVVMQMTAGPDAAARYPNGALAATAVGGSASVSASVPQPPKQTPPPVSVSALSSASNSSAPKLAAFTPAAANLSAAVVDSGAGQSASSIPPLWSSLAGLAALVVLGVAGVWYARVAAQAGTGVSTRGTPTSAEEFNIE